MGVHGRVLRARMRTVRVRAIMSTHAMGMPLTCTVWHGDMLVVTVCAKGECGLRAHGLNRNATGRTWGNMACIMAWSWDERGAGAVASSQWTNGAAELRQKAAIMLPAAHMPR